MPTVEQHERSFEDWGLGKVKMLMMTHDLPDPMKTDAVNWVARHEEEERQREIASETEGRRIARRTLIAAWIAAGASIVAIAVACLAWLFPHT